MANKPGEANLFPNVPVYPEMGTFQPVYGKFDLTTYIQGASDYEIMAFLVGKYNACLEAYGTVTKLSSDTVKACKQLQEWINSWFTNLDVQEELNNKIDSMVQDGSFGRLLHQTFDAQINQQTTNAVTQWLVANVTPTGSAVVVDKSLSIEGAAADAKVTGDAVGELNKGLINGFVGENTIGLEKLEDISKDKTINKVIISNTSQGQNTRRITIDSFVSMGGLSIKMVVVDGLVNGNCKDFEIYYNINGTQYSNGPISNVRGKEYIHYERNIGTQTGIINVFIEIFDASTDIVLENVKMFVFDVNNNIYTFNLLYDELTESQLVGSMTITKSSKTYTGYLKNTNNDKYGWFKNKKILYFGDSITDTTGNNPINYPFQIQKITGAENVNYAAYSSGYSMNCFYPHEKWGQENTITYKMIERAFNDGKTADFIIVASGTNDWDFGRPYGNFNDIFSDTEVDSFYWYVSKAIKTLLDKYPLVPYLFIIPTPRNQNDGNITQHTVKQDTGKTLIDYCNAIKEVCNYYSIPYLDMMNNSNMHLESEVARNRNTSDGLHPTEWYNYNVYAPMVISKISEMVN